MRYASEGSHTVYRTHLTVLTMPGHVFHRDCVAQRATQPGATCCLCGASLREDNKFTKIFVTYDEDEHDEVLSNLVKRSVVIERRLEKRT